MTHTTLRTLALVPVLLSPLAAAQELFVNAGGSPSNPALGTGTTARNGTPAPAGAQWSELSTEFGAANILGGVSAHAVLGPASYRVADDFAVTGSQAWLITGLRFFAYEPDIGAPGSPVAAANVRIWNAPPGSLGATVVWGDTATNIATVSSPTPFLRIFSSDTAPAPFAPNQARAIWQIDVPVSARLEPGEYWIDWQFMLRAESGAAFTPTATIAASRSPEGADALQFDDASGWTPIIDQGRPSGASDEYQELPFAIIGGISCPADVDNSGGVDGDDIIYFFGFWDQNQMDFNHDGGTDGDDIIAFFARWDSNC